MLPSIPSLPWYTVIALLAFALVALGALLGVIRLTMASVFYLLASTWLTVQHLWLWAFGTSLTSHGTAHWAVKREMMRSNLFRTDGIALAKWGKHTLREPRGGHIALFGPPRSRKSWGMIMPAITDYPGSVVVTDLRGELHERTHDAREHLGPVFQFAPSQVNSCHFNLLDAVRWGTPFEFGDTHRIVDHLVCPTLDDRKNPFARAAVPLLVSIAIHSRLIGAGSFPDALQWMVEPGQSLEQKLQELLASSHPIVQAGARRTLDQSERLRASVWNAALDPLTIFQDPLIASHTEKSDFALEDLLHGISPMTLYLCPAFGDISRLSAFLGALVETLVHHLGSPHVAPRHKVLLCLDEAANLGRLTELEKAVSYLQGSGTQALLTFQNLLQVIDTYGEHSPLLASVGTHIHYTPSPLDLVTASAISTALGQGTIAVPGFSESFTSSAQGGGYTQGTTTSHQARSLLLPDEILRLDQNAAIVFTQGTHPILATKLDVPPPTRAQRVTHTVWTYQRYGYVAAALALWALALSPLTTQPQLHPKAISAALQPRGLADTFNTSLTPAPVVQAATLPWVFGSSDTQAVREAGFAPTRFSSAAECMGFLTARYSLQLENVQRLMSKTTVVKEPLRWTWKIPRLGGKLEEHAAWCVEEPAQDTATR